MPAVTVVGTAVGGYVWSVDAKEGQDKQQPLQASSTSPPDGRIDKATKPPCQGEVDREAVAKGWEALDRAAGAH